VDWNAQVQDMNQLINSMKEYIDASKASLDAAQQALQSIEAEITHCDSIRNSLLPLLPQLRTIRLDADTLRKKNQETSNKALDIAGFLSRLSVKADTIQLGFTAQEFAQRVLDVQSVLDGRRPKGIMWDHPVRLESTLRMIVSSSVPAADVDDLM
jgi:chromosome segregation ATPase